MLASHSDEFWYVATNIGKVIVNSVGDRVVVITVNIMYEYLTTFCVGLTSHDFDVFVPARRVIAFQLLNSIDVEFTSQRFNFTCNFI